MEFFSKKAWTWISVLLWLVFHSMGDLVGAVVCSAAVGFLCIHFILKARENEDALSGNFEDYVSFMHSFSEKKITMILIQEELKKYAHEGQPIARKTIRLRCVVTPVYILAHFALINGLYDRRGCAVGCMLLSVFYMIFYIRSSTVRVLRRRARKESHKDFAQIVREEIATPEQIGRAKARAIAGIALFAVSMVGFFAFRSVPRWEFEKREGGYVVTGYKPALLEQQIAEVPAVYQGEPVIAIAETALQGKIELEVVVLPSSVKTIGKQAFQGCGKLRDVKLPEGLQTIGSGAFMDCEKLERITLPSTLTQLMGQAFQNTGLTGIQIPEGVTEIRGDTFKNCDDLEEVQLHDGIVDIHAGAFSGCSDLKTIALPKYITEIHANTFEDCEDLERIHIPYGVTRIAAHAFAGCEDLQEVYVPDTVQEIRSSAFRDCESLRSIELPAGVMINSRAFKDSPTKITYREPAFDFDLEPVA